VATTGVSALSATGEDGAGGADAVEAEAPSRSHGGVQPASCEPTAAPPRTTSPVSGPSGSPGPSPPAPAPPLQIPRRRAHHGRRDLARARAEAGHEGPVAHEVDDAGHAPAVLEDARHRRAGEGHRAGESGDAKPVLDVAIGILPAQGLEVAADADALVELAELAALELFLQLRLPREHDLEQLAGGRLQRGEDANLLEGLVGHLLGLVEHDHHRLAFRTRGEEVLVQGGHQLTLGGPAPLEAEVVEDGSHQLHIGEVRVEDERALHLAGQLAQQGPTQRGLPGPHVADEGDQALLAGDPVEEGGENLVMALRAEQEPRVGREDERRILEAEERLVHRATSPPSCRRRPRKG